MTVQGVLARAAWFRSGRSLAVTALLAALIGSSIVPARAEPQAVTIGVSSRSFNPGFSNMWIGIPIGLYKPDLTPEAVGTQGASENLQLMLSGRVTMSTGIQDVLLNAQAQGRTLPVVIPCVYVRGMIHRISVLPDSPIRTFADLKDKTVGVPTLAAGQVPYLKYAAKAAGIDPDSIHIVAVGYGQQAAVSLTTKQVDALAHIDVDVARLGSLGIKTRELAQPDSMQNAAIAYVFAFTRAWYSANRDAAAKLVQGMIKAIVVSLENPEAAVRISYQMHPEGVPTGIPFAKAVADGVLTINARAPSVVRSTSPTNRWCDFTEDRWKQYAGILGLDDHADAMKFYTNELIDKINDFDEAGLQAWARGLKVPEAPAEFQSWAASLQPPR